MRISRNVQHVMSRFAAFEWKQVRELLDERQRPMVNRGYRWCILDKETRRVCSLHLRQELADRRALSLESSRRRRG